MAERLRLYMQLMRLHRPIGIYLLLWPTLWALWLASAGRPDPLILTVFVLGVVVMRSAGCVINDYADRHIDPWVQRTKHRPLATGQVSSREALSLFAGLCGLAFGLVCLLNLQTVLLSLAALALAALYPFMKRHTHWPQAVLGAAYGWAIPMAFTAQTGMVPPLGWWLFATALAWTVAYDTYYAMADRADDLKIGVKSTAVLFGQADLLIIGLIQTGVLISLFFIGQTAGLGLYYQLGLTVATGLAIYQQIISRHREPAQCFQAFLNNHWLGLAVFVGMAADYGLS